ncbi:MAG: flagellar basal body P-ring formation protein FlgA [Rhizobiales bacterium]|nr:flagellar basal body P-ring formation protein FlgA [Hyphomicrobiales bacterium]
MARGQRPVKLKPRGLLARMARALLGAALIGSAPSIAFAADLVFPVPRVTIYPGEIITEGMLIEKAFRGRDYERPGLLTSRQGLVGKVARSTLLPQVPVSTTGVREPYTVQQGQPAVVIFKSGTLIISATAVSLQSGSAGDIISLRNTDSGTTIRGTVQADGSVRVGVP